MQECAVEIQELTEFFKEVQDFFYTFDFKNIAKLFGCPLLVIENAKNFAISNPNTTEIFLESVLNVYSQLGLKAIDFKVIYARFDGPTIVSTAVNWILQNSSNQYAAEFQIGYQLQKKESWKIVTIIRPGWEDLVHAAAVKELIRKEQFCPP